MAHQRCGEQIVEGVRFRYGSNDGDDGDFKVLPVTFKPDQVAEAAGRELDSDGGGA